MPRKPNRKPNPNPNPSPPSSSSSSSPFPALRRPSPAECRAARDALLALHGFPPEFAGFRRSRAEPASQRESVLDGLVITLLSQNSTEVNSRKAFERMKLEFPDWDQVMEAESKDLEDAIRCGGLAPTKAARIKTILKTIKEKRGEICLEYLRSLSINEVKKELSQFKGIGPKTVACVLMFYLQKDDFPVDTHVFQITKGIGWIPKTSSRETAYLHLNKRIPNELKFDLNCLFVAHGKLCNLCKNVDRQQIKKLNASCPLVSLTNFDEEEVHVKKQETES